MPEAPKVPEVRGKMASIAVIANPLAKLRDQVLLYQSGDKTYGLRVSPRSLLDFTVKASIGPSDPETVVRRLAQPGQLVSFVHQDTLQVYGITGDKVTDLQVDLLSPVQNALDLKPVTGALAGCAKPTNETAYLYMIKNEKGKPKIVEWTLTSKTPVLRPLNCPDFSMDTNLYAVYDATSDRPYLIYQNNKNELVVHDAKKDKGYVVNYSDSRVMPKTPIAAAIVPAGGEGKEKREQRIVLYFIGIQEGENRFLWTANGEMSGKGKEITFDETEEQPRVVDIDDAKYNLEDWAGLSAYVDEPRQRVVVFGLTTKIEGQEGVFEPIAHPVSRSNRISFST